MTLEKEEEKKVIFPKMVCENCGFINQLSFNPLVDGERMSQKICGRCRQFAYWAIYWETFQVQSEILFRNMSPIREQIHENKIQLTSFLKKIYA